jgi:transposase
LLGFEDESGISEKPVVRRTWALRGKTPVIPSAGSWKNLTMAALLVFTPEGRRPRVAFRLQAGAMKKEDFLRYLKDIKRMMRGRKLLLIWDRLAGHRAGIVARWIKTQTSWLRVEHYPGYAPELSPVEYLWAPIKTKHLANLPPKGFPDLTRKVRRAFRNVRRDQSLLTGCLRKAAVLT